MSYPENAINSFVNAILATEEYKAYAFELDKVKQYLQYNYMQYDISLDSVSKIVNMAPAYFSSRFKKCFAVNFVDYVAELRMNAAKELLQDPLRSTAEIAGMVGYDSANYFTRAFKKHTGMTPTEFRRGQIRKRGI